MKTYEKTYNLYQRFKEKPNIGKYDTTKLWTPEFGMIKPGGWVWTEKLDGMNMRVAFTKCLGHLGGQFTTQILGRTDKAQIPGDLLQNIMDMVAARTEKIQSALNRTSADCVGITLYGEGIGPGIQKGGGYCDQKLFVTFDAALCFESGGQYYLSPDDLTALVEELDLIQAPRLFEGQGVEAVQRRVRAGIVSLFAKVFDGADTEKMAEGVIGIVPGLYYYTAGGMRRLKCKIKTKDFPSNL